MGVCTVLREFCRRIQLDTLRPLRGIVGQSQPDCSEASFSVYPSRVLLESSPVFQRENGYRPSFLSPSSRPCQNLE